MRTEQALATTKINAPSQTRDIIIDPFSQANRQADSIAITSQKIEVFQRNKIIATTLIRLRDYHTKKLAED